MTMTEDVARALKAPVLEAVLQVIRYNNNAMVSPV